MKKIYTVAKYAKSIMLAAVMTASALTTANAQEADNTTYAPAEANSWWRGEEVTGKEQQVYVYNVGAGIFVTTDDTPSEKKYRQCCTLDSFQQPVQLWGLPHKYVE